MSDNPSEGRPISRAAFSHIIRRAVKFDEDRADSIPEEDLYGIARELGISEAAVTQALREEVAVVPPRTKQWWRLRAVLRRWTIQAGLCGMAGSTAMMVMKDGIPLNGWFPLLVPLLFRSLQQEG